MVRPILCFLVICFLAGCKRDWTNVCIEKRVYRDGYYFHVPDKKFTPVNKYVPPVPFPTATGNTVIDRPVQPIYSVTTPDSTPVFYPRPYTPPPPVPAYMYTYIAPKDTAARPTGMGGGGNGSGMKNTNDSVPPKEHWATGTPVKSDSAMDQVVSRQDTSHSVAERDTLLSDTASEFIVRAKYKERKYPDVETDGFLQLGMITGPESYGYPVKMNSFSAAAGVRYKMKLCSWDKLTWDFAYRFHQFYIDQDDPKVFPLSAATHDRERISVNNFSVGLSNRIIYRRGEEQPPCWLDLGVYGDALMRSSNVYVDVVNDPTSLVADRSKVTTKNVHLNYMRKFNYGVTVRAGWNRYSCFAMWRVSDLVKNSSSENRSDLPRLVIGVEVSFGEEY
jgi:hypothetical protein